MSDMHADDALLEELGVDVEVLQPRTQDKYRERVVTGIEDLLDFRESNGRLPCRDSDAPLMERTHALRLEQIRKDWQSVLLELDPDGRLQDENAGTQAPAPLDAVPKSESVEDLSPSSPTLQAHPENDGSERKIGSASSLGLDADTLDDDELLSALGMSDDALNDDSVSTLRHVRHSTARAQSLTPFSTVASRTSAKDFEQFRPQFESVLKDIRTGRRKLRKFGGDGASGSSQKSDAARISEGDYFVLGGQLLYVAEVVDDKLGAPNGESDERLRVIYDNGTESNIRRRSLQRALYKENGKSGRGRVEHLTEGPLFDTPLRSGNDANTASQDDVETGTIYVLRSHSDHPVIRANRQVIHKIGVTRNDVPTRIAAAAKDPTYLLADVEVVASYKLYNIRRTALEYLLHRIFASARLDISLTDRFGHPVKPREWFVVPLPVMDQAIGLIQSGQIERMIYDPKRACLIESSVG